MIKCVSCTAEIPDQFVACLSKNVCPICDGAIMSSGMLELLQGLESAFEQMPNNPRGIAGWLISNYSLTKTGEAKPINFYTPKKTGAVKLTKANFEGTENDISQPTEMSEIALKIAKKANVSFKSADEIKALKARAQQSGSMILEPNEEISEDDDNDSHESFSTVAPTPAENEILERQARMGDSHSQGESPEIALMKLKKYKAVEGISSGVGGFRKV
jgi:hypothetical protein